MTYELEYQHFPEKISFMQENVETMISYIFGKYDMRKGSDNKIKMHKLLEFCMDDIRMHPTLVNALSEKEALEYFVVQSMIYMIK